MGPAKHAKRREKGREPSTGSPMSQRANPTLDAVGTRSCVIRRCKSKKRATTIFELPLQLGPHSSKKKRREF